MDWGFVRVEDRSGGEFKIACFAMVCHHCGTCHVEFFPNARQDNLFIGMVRAFMAMGVPECVLTDNMRSVTAGRDIGGRPVWQVGYAAFMACVGFGTKLCKPYHLFTKGKVERLVKYVKGGFVAGRKFYSATDPNAQALEWCAKQSGRYRRAVDCVPADEHSGKCLPAAAELERTEELAMHLRPRRRAGFDGFVSYEGRRFGVPCWYPGRTCRVSRDDEWVRAMRRHGALHRRVGERAASFGVEISPDELAELAVRGDMGRSEPAALEAVFAYLAGKHHDQVIETLLKLSRLSRKAPRPSRGFGRICGRDAAVLRKLPALSNLHARKNLAFIGPGGIGKAHLAQAYGRACCPEGFKTYCLKATELRDRLKEKPLIPATPPGRSPCS